MQLCGSLSILWHCLSLGLEWKLTFSSPVATVVQCLDNIYQGHPKQTVLTVYIKFIKQTLNTFWIVCMYMYSPLMRSVLSNSFVTPWTVAHQAPLSKGFPRQAYQSELPFPSPGDLPNSRDQTLILCIGRQILYHWATREALLTLKSLRSFLLLA